MVVIRPVFPYRTPLELKANVSGVPKLARLNRLKNSARNCRLVPSVIRVFLISEKSTVAKPGPITVFRPKLP